jgi:hypothetical protein
MTQPGQQYGKRTAQAQSQSILPVSAPPQPTGALPGPTTPSTPAGGASGAPTPQGLPQAFTQVTPLTAPTQRPQVPVTNGLPTGPGPGPEVLRGFAGMAHQQLQGSLGTAKSILSELASQPGASSVVQQLAANA